MRSVCGAVVVAAVALPPSIGDLHCGLGNEKTLVGRGCRVGQHGIFDNQETSRGLCEDVAHKRGIRNEHHPVQKISCYRGRQYCQKKKSLTRRKELRTRPKMFRLFCLFPWILLSWVGRMTTRKKKRSGSEKKCESHKKMTSVLFLQG